MPAIGFKEKIQITLCRILLWKSMPAALFIGTIDAVSEFNDVYIDKREPECA